MNNTQATKLIAKGIFGTVDEDYLNKSIVEGLSYQDAENSLYEYIEKKLGLKISFARRSEL